jgi:hypothetical protein
MGQPGKRSERTIQGMALSFFGQTVLRRK